MTHLYTIFLQKAPNLGHIGCFFSYIFQNTPNFANWAHWVCDDNPPIDIPKLTKMHLKTFEHPRIPCVSENPPPGVKAGLVYVLYTLGCVSLCQMWLTFWMDNYSYITHGKGVLHLLPQKAPKLVCFALYLKIINILLKNNICIL